MIELVDISLRFGQHIVFSHFHTALPDAGVVLLMGESGAGKTTLLRLLAGLLRPDAGEIRGLEARKLSFAFQEPRLLPGRTALDNVRLVSDSDTAEAMLTRLNMREARHDSARTLSGGQQQRVSLARAFAYSDDMVLLDEPFSGLDDRNRQCAAALIRTAKLAVVVTHEAQDAALLDACLTLHL